MVPNWAWNTLSACSRFRYRWLGPGLCSSMSGPKPLWVGAQLGLADYMGPSTRLTPEHLVGLHFFSGSGPGQGALAVFLCSWAITLTNLGLTLIDPNPNQNQNPLAQGWPCRTPGIPWQPVTSGQIGSGPGGCGSGCLSLCLASNHS